MRGSGNGLRAQTVHGSQLGLLYGVLNGRWVLRLLPRLMIVSCSGSSVGTNRKWPMATWIVTPAVVTALVTDWLGTKNSSHGLLRIEAGSKPQHNNQRNSRC